MADDVLFVVIVATNGAAVESETNISHTDVWLTVSCQKANFCFANK